MPTTNLQSPNIHVIHLWKEAGGHADTGRACTHESQSSGCYQPSRHLRSHHEEAFRVERLHFLCTETLFSLTSFFDLMIFPLHCRQRLIYWFLRAKTNAKQKELCSPGRVMQSTFTLFLTLLNLGLNPLSVCRSKVGLNYWKCMSCPQYSSSVEAHGGCRLSQSLQSILRVLLSSASCPDICMVLWAELRLYFKQIKAATTST